MNNISDTNGTMKDKGYYRKSLFFSVLFFAFSIIFYNLSDGYTNEHQGNPVSDLILDNTPVMNFYGIYIYGPVLVWLFLLIVCFAKPRSFPFVLKSMALLIIVRSIFTTLTHIGSPNHTIVLGHNPFTSMIIKQIDFGGDLFFSGHTGFPFLMGLIFWPYLSLRVIFISSSIIFAFVVLACHVHYSIDVLAAFFIAHSIYIISRKIFAKDYKYFAE